MQIKAITLTSAIALINDALYQAAVGGSDNHKRLSLKEREQLFQLRSRLNLLSKTARLKLHVEEMQSFEPEEITKKQADQLQVILQESCAQLEIIISQVEKEVKSSHSEDFIKCLTALSELLKKYLQLARKNIGLTKEVIEDFFTSMNLFKLCRVNGVLYLPISQALDPFLGGFEEEGKVKESEGECAGKVISWIEACSQGNDIKYPFYAGTFDKIFQQTQRDYKAIYKVVEASDLLTFCEKILANLKKDKLYFVGLNSLKGNGHAIGIRIRQDGVYELFDPNYFHAFTADPKSFRLVLQYLLTTYFIESNFNLTCIYEANIEQFGSKQGIFPHKTHIVQAATVKNNEAADQEYYSLICDLGRDMNGHYKLHANGEAFLIYKTIFQDLLALINYPKLLIKLLQNIGAKKPELSFIETQENKDSLLKLISERLATVNSIEFQRNFNENNKTVEALKSVQQYLLSQMNDIRANFGDSKQVHDPNQQIKTKKLLLLTRKSIALWHLLNTSNQTEKVDRKKSVDTSENKLASILKEVFGIESMNAPILELVNNALERELQTSQNRIVSSYGTGKNSLRFIITLENIISILNLLEQHLPNGELAKGEDDLTLSMFRLVKAKLRLVRKEIQQIINDAKLGENWQLLEQKLKKLLPLSSAEFAQVHDNVDTRSMEHAVLQIILDQITPLEIRAEAAGGQRVARYHEIKTLLASIQKLINHIESVKEEYDAENLGSFLSKSRNPMQMILAKLRLARIDSYSNRVKELILIKNTIIKQCTERDNDAVFLEMSRRVRTSYPELFPVDFTLIDDYQRRLDQLLGKNIPIIIRPCDHELVNRLTGAFKLLTIAIEACQSLQSRSHMRALTGAKYEAAERQSIFFSESNNANDYIRIINDSISIFSHLLIASRDEQEIIAFTEAYIVPFLKNNQFDLHAYLSASCKPSEEQAKVRRGVKKAVRDPYEEVLQSPQMNLIIKEIKGIFEAIYNVDKENAVRVLFASNVQLTDDGTSVVLLDYGLVLAKRMIPILKDMRCSDQIKGRINACVLTLNQIFCGKVTSLTENLWKKLNLVDEEGSHAREQFGLIAFKYFKELCSQLEQRILRELHGQEKTLRPK